MEIGDVRIIEVEENEFRKYEVIDIQKDEKGRIIAYREKEITD